MSLFQCAKCGCRENTALSDQGFIFTSSYNWTGLEDFKGQKLCCVCGPTKHCDDTPVSKAGKWHERFPRRFLPKGMFKTARDGNLENVQTGEQDSANHFADEEYA